MTLNAKIGVFTDFFRNMRLHKSLSFTRRRHHRQRHTRLWLMCIRVPMGRVQVICIFQNYNYRTGNAIGFRASRELCSNFLFVLRLYYLLIIHIIFYFSCKIFFSLLNVFLVKKTAFLYLLSLWKLLCCRKGRDLYEKNVAPLLHLAGLEITLVKVNRCMLF